MDCSLVRFKEVAEVAHPEARMSRSKETSNGEAEVCSFYALLCVSVLEVYKTHFVELANKFDFCMFSQS